MGHLERRTYYQEVPADLRAALDLRDEELRLASFRYSAQVVAGSKPSFRYLDTTTEIGAGHVTRIDAVSDRNPERRGAVS